MSQVNAVLAAFVAAGGLDSEPAAKSRLDDAAAVRGALLRIGWVEGCCGPRREPCWDPRVHAVKPAAAAREVMRELFPEDAFRYDRGW